jgi:hypothetical protein
MATQTQLFNALVRKHEQTSFKKFSRNLLSNLEYSNGYATNLKDLKDFLEWELNHIYCILKQTDKVVQWHNGYAYFYTKSECLAQIERLKEVIVDMKYKVYTNNEYAFFAINPTKIHSHFVKFN